MVIGIAFGTKVKDSVTGFVGFVTARCEYMNGCVQYEVTPRTLKDGVPQKEYWLDEQRVVEVVKKMPKPTTKVVPAFKPTIPRQFGGAQNHPKRHTPPSLAGHE